jgi:hypothetical protein
MATITIATRNARINVGPTIADTLEPVRLTIHGDGGVFSFQDYLTPVQARDLSGLLTATADAVDGGPVSLEEQGVRAFNGALGKVFGPVAS